MDPSPFFKMKKEINTKMLEKKVLGSRENREATRAGYFKTPIKPKRKFTNRPGAK